MRLAEATTRMEPARCTQGELGTHRTDEEGSHVHHYLDRDSIDSIKTVVNPSRDAADKSSWIDPRIYLIYKELLSTA